MFYNILRGLLTFVDFDCLCFLGYCPHLRSMPPLEDIRGILLIFISFLVHFVHWPYAASDLVGGFSFLNTGLFGIIIHVEFRCVGGFDSRGVFIVR